MTVAHPPGARPAAGKTECCTHVLGRGRNPLCTGKQVACVTPGYLRKSYVATEEGAMQWEGLISPKATHLMANSLLHDLIIPESDMQLHLVTRYSSWPCLPLEPPAHTHTTVLVAVL